MSFKGKWLRVVPAIVLLLSLGLIQQRTALASSVNLLNTFQLDGNPQACVPSTSPTSDDWDSALIHAGFSGVNTPSCSTSSITNHPIAAQFLNDAISTETDSFTGGSTKDNSDIGSWLWVPGAPQAKDTLEQVGAAVYSVPVDSNPANNHEILTLMSTRLAQNGAANQSFWFFQSPVSQKYNTGTTCTISSGCGFNGVHTFGDLLTQIGWTTGGTVASVSIFEWIGNATAPTGCTPVSNVGNLCQLYPNAGQPAAPACGPVTGPVCAIANNATNQASVPASCAGQPAGTVASPWAYNPKSGVANCIPASGFMDAGLDLTALGLGGRCFSTFDGETRSSPSVDSTLSDFEMGTFPLCTASMTINAGNTNEVGIPHTFQLTAYQTIAGNTASAAGATLGASIDTKSTATPAAIYAGSTVPSNVSCATGLGPNPPQSVSNLTTDNGGHATVTVLSCNPGQVLVDGSGTVPINGTNFPVSVKPGATNTDCSTASQCGVKTYVDAAITISPLSANNSVGQYEMYAVTVYQNLGLGNGWVVAPSEPVTVTITNDTTPSPGAALSTSPPTVCPTTPVTTTVSGNTNASGVFAAYVDACAKGDVTVHASTAFAITSNGSTSTTLTRITGGSVASCSPSTLTVNAPGCNSPDALKHFKSAQITLTKTVQLGPFTAAGSVCFTLAYDASDIGPHITPIANDATGSVTGGTNTLNTNNSFTECRTPPANTTPVITTATLTYSWDGLATGAYDVTEGTLPAGYGTPTLSWSNPVSVDAVNGPASLALTASDPLIPGSIFINKTVNGGATPVPTGTTFTFTIDKCGASSTVTSGVMTNCVVDSGFPQQQATITGPASSTHVDGLDEGWYKINEINVPAGFVINTTLPVYLQVHAGVTTSQSYNSTTIDNTLLYKIVVFVCDAGGNLHATSITTGDSRLTPDSTTSMSTPPSGFTSKQVCALGPTSYSNLQPNTGSNSGVYHIDSINIQP